MKPKNKAKNATWKGAKPTVLPPNVIKNQKCKCMNVFGFLIT